jgi:sugar phosphate isomerase/epimerase
MKFGMPTLIELSDLKSTADLCCELDLNFIELNMNMPQFCPERLESGEIKRISKESRIEFTIHLPEETDLATFHEAVRLGHMERCKEAVLWASESGIRLVNLHVNNGVYFTLPERKVYIYAQNAELFTEKIVHSFAELNEMTKQKGITLCVENCGDFGTKHVKYAVSTLLQKGLAHLTWDVGHDAKAGYYDLEFIKANISSLKHMHLHDADDKSDHQVLFSGKVDIHQRIKIARDNNLNIVVEVKTIDALRESVRRLKEHGYL